MLNKLRPGLTLVEVVVVLLVLILAMTLLVPALMEARQQARQRDCANKLRTVALAMHSYHKAHTMFPSAGVINLPIYEIKKITLVDPALDGRAPWTVLLLPFLGETTRYNRFNMEAPFYARYDEIAGSGPRDGTPNNTFAQDQDAPSTYHCPDNPGCITDPYILSYYACQGGGNVTGTSILRDVSGGKINPLGPARNTAEKLPHEAELGGNGQLFWTSGMFFPNSGISLTNVRDGTSQSIMLGEQAYVGLRRVYTPIKKSHGGPLHWTWASAIRGHPRHPALFSTAATFDPINDPGEWPEGIERVREIGGALRGYGQQQRGFSSWHAGGANFAFADGSVRFLNETMDLYTFQIMGSIRDGFRPDDFANKYSY